MIFAAIFSVVGILFTSLLVAAVRLGGRQSAATEVAQQSQFLLQYIERQVQLSSMIDQSPDISMTTINLRMTDPALDPTLIFVSGTDMYARQGSATSTRLTSERVLVTDVAFTKRANAGGRDTVAVGFTVMSNPTGTTSMFLESLGSSVSRVSAATFDSDLRTSSTNVYKIGATTQEWQSINNTIFFGGNSNVGINITPTTNTVMLQVSGGDIYVNNADKGVILKSPNGLMCRRLGITNAGAIRWTTVSCP